MRNTGAGVWGDYTADSTRTGGAGACLFGGSCDGLDVAGYLGLAAPWRGVQATGATTVTSAMLGRLRTDVRTRPEFLAVARG
ncbi:hypothetical protein [Paractinoplanes durhamensis]|uniref:Uncharacterized protein n=1 Tax=Paractinoplanes durhamensis TaxID=113563 RepID=A0ABQ3ZCR3_9ACTN|nr:hypothetical protein Adu01nite_89310 [Actinoplanes durhamensis]